LNLSRLQTFPQVKLQMAQNLLLFFIKSGDASPDLASNERGRS